LIALVLSYFDRVIGPRLLLKTDNIPDHIKVEHVPLLMDFYQTGFFTHEFGNLLSANYIYHIPNPAARGGRELFMISLLAYEEKFELESYSEILNIFVRRFKELSLPSRGTELIAGEISETPPDVFEAIKELFYRFFNSLPREREVFRLRISKIFFYGLPKAGITTIIECLRGNFLNKKNLDKEISIFKTLLGNLSILDYNFTYQKHKPIREILKYYLNQIDGVVFVVDASDEDKFDMAKNELHRICDYLDTQNLPLLILLNKIDLPHPPINEITQKLEINQLKEFDLKVFPVSAINNDGISMAFNWLAIDIASRILKDPSKVFL